jgi:hypothetical protein
MLIIDMVSASHFPELPAVDHHAHIREQLVYLSFRLCRTCFLDGLRSTVVQVLRDIQSRMREDFAGFSPYLDLFYRMVGQTRDMFGGKGEKSVSYVMLLGLYEVYPVLAIYALHRFVLPLGNLVKKRRDTYVGAFGSWRDTYVGAFGSWRDIKYFCEYVMEEGGKGKDHPFIEIGVSIINTQLGKDVENMRHRCHWSRLSYVAKWIPRENKHFHWLFEKLALDWCRRHTPYILATIGEDSYIRAITKYKRNYRKIISRINRQLDTVEQKQCSQQIDLILPETIGAGTLCKQRRLCFENPDFSKRFGEYYENIPSPTTGWSKVMYLPEFPPVTYFVTTALRMVGGHYDRSGSRTLNQQWVNLVATYKHLYDSMIIPVLDVSWSMDETSYSQGVGLALLMACAGTMRILTIEQNPCWIELDVEGSFLDHMENLEQSLCSQKNTVFCFKKLMDIFSGMSYRMCEPMTLVLFSDFIEEKVKTMDMDRWPGSIVFWNTGTGGENMRIMDRKRTALVSGGAPLPLCVQGTPFENLVQQLSSPRYDVFSHYLKDLWTNYG